MREYQLQGARAGFTRCAPPDATGTSTFGRPNYGFNVGDDAALVNADRQALARWLAVPLQWMNQTHSDRVVVIDECATAASAPVDADAMVTAAPIALAVQVADCLPVLVADPNTGLRAAIHAGRAGIDSEIITRTLRTMVDLGALSSDLQVVVGPHICSRCYEVGEEVYRRSTSTHPALRARTPQGTYALDLGAGALWEVQQFGARMVEVDRRCTRENRELHSYRRQPRCGRNAGWIAPPVGLD